MNKRQTLAAILALLVCATTGLGIETRNPAAVAVRHNGILKRVDTGGDLLVVANVDGMVEALVDKLVSLTELAPTDDAKAQAAIEKIRRMPAFLKRNGLYAVRGVGVSIVPRVDGLNNVKIFLQRDQRSAELPFWRGFFGGKQKRLTGLDLLPTDTALVRLCNADVKPLWGLIRPAIVEFGSEDMAKSFDGAVAAAAQMLGVEVATLVSSIGDEGFVSLQLSKTETVEFPVNPQHPIKVPLPSILAGVSIKDGTLPGVIQAQLDRAAQAGSPLPTMVKNIGNVKVTTLNLPIPAPFPVEPTFCTVSGYFLLGSNRGVVEKAVIAATRKNGLTATSDFKKAYQGLPMSNNGIFYIHPRLGKTIAELAQTSVKASSPKPSDRPAVNLVMGQLDRLKTMSHAMVFQNFPDGVLISGKTAAGGRELIASMGVAPMGVLAAIAIPSFTKARTNARKAACINNLRMLDAAKEMWALENDKTEGAKPTMNDLAPYIKDVTRIKCTQGGKYTLDAIGEKPTCSRPDHRL